MSSQVTRPDYEAFLQYMCPGFQDTGLYIPIGDDTNICPNPIIGAGPTFDTLIPVAFAHSLLLCKLPHSALTLPWPPPHVYRYVAFDVRVVIQMSQIMGANLARIHLVELDKVTWT